MIHSALPGRASHWHFPQTQILAMHIHWGWRSTIQPYIQGCHKLFISSSPRADLDIPWGSTQSCCPQPGPPWSVQPRPSALPGDLHLLSCIPCAHEMGGSWGCPRRHSLGGCSPSLIPFGCPHLLLSCTSRVACRFAVALVY